MTSRTRFLITAALLCHLLFAHPLVTSQLRSAETPSAPQTLPNVPPALIYEDVTLRALTQEQQGAVSRLHGEAEIHCGAYVLHADEATYNKDTGEATADGHVVLDGGLDDEHVQANHATYNIRTEVGRFEQVHGTVGLRMRGPRLLLTSSNPVVFSGKVVVKTGPRHYAVYDGAITTCELPRPKWQFRARRIVVDVGGNAQIYHSTFRLMGIPIFYFPYATHPIESVRQSGFAIPDFGTSSSRGKILGESAYWAIDRSMDLEADVQYFSARGWAPRAEFRARPNPDSFVDLNFSSVFDRQNEGGEEVRLDAQTIFPKNTRGVANIDYLSSYVYRLVFNDVFTQAVNSEVRSQAFVSNTNNGFFNNVATERYQDFESTTAGDVITILHAPSFDLASDDRELGHSPFYWSYDAEAGGLSRSEPGFHTAPLVARIDLNPILSLPLILGGWSLRPQLVLHETFYSQQLQPAGILGSVISDPINRKALEGSVDLRPPSLERVFGREFLGRKWKHVIEPSATYRYVTGVDNFAKLLHFDERDILTDTNEVEYGLVNRLYAKRSSAEPEDCGPAGMPGLEVGGQAPSSQIPWEQTMPQDAPCQAGPPVREVVTWELAQKYYLDPSFGGALVPGTRNVFDATVDLTGIAFLDDARRLSPLVSRLRIQPTSRADAEWDLDYDIKNGRIDASTALLSYRFGLFTFGGGNAFLQTPGEPGVLGVLPEPERFDQFRVLAGYGRTDKQGFSGAANVGFDAHLGFVQYASVQTAYNWNCCGLNIEYRRFSLGTVRNENQFRFTFALANIGTLGNLRRQERLF